MRWKLRRCIACGTYTLHQDTCPACGGKVKIPHPPKFSPQDPYGRYRRKLKKELRQGKWKKSG